MSMYACNKCGSLNLRLEERGSQTALICNDCSKWLKWVGKSELPIVKRFIEEQNEELNKITKSSSSLDENANIVFDILQDELGISEIMFNTDAIKQAIKKALDVINE